MWCNYENIEKKTAQIGVTGDGHVPHGILCLWSKTLRLMISLLWLIRNVLRWRGP